MNQRNFAFSLFLFFLFSIVVMAQGTRLLRHPTVSKEAVVFNYAGDLWAVSRTGGLAKRLTSTPGEESNPYFSPDGSRIAFTATFGGNTDVYIMPAAGGDPIRLTYHPGDDRVKGWTPDGRHVLFSSVRTSSPQQAYYQLWTVNSSGGTPEPVKLPRAYSGSYSSDGSMLAYEEYSTAFVPQWYEASMWRHYRGGRTHPISVINLSDNSVENLPWNNSNDSDPMWVGNTIYFISDREHTSNLFAYRTDTRKVSKLTNHTDFDIMNATSGAGAIVYEQAGYIHLLETAGGRSKRLNIQINGDLPWTRPQHKKVAALIRNAGLSPGGIRAVFEARGEIFTVPSDKGDTRNLSRSSGAHDRDPVWSPDGSEIAWLSDASGEYQLMLGDPSGLKPPRAVSLPGTAFYSNLSWSPDGKRILLEDNHKNLWTVTVAGGAAENIDIDEYGDPTRDLGASWSPDSRWITYSKNLKSRMRAIFVYSVEEKKAYRITDGLADAISPVFDAGGKYLYFLASTNFGPNTGWLEMSSLERPVRRSIYLAVLNSSDPSPFLPETGDVPVKKSDSAKPAAGQSKSDDLSIRIDFSGISQRILSVNVRPSDFRSIAAGPAETFFYTESVQGSGRVNLNRYQIKARAGSPFMSGISQFSVSADKKKLLYGAGGSRWGIVGTAAPAKVGDGSINVGQLEMRIDPRAEWANIFRETWRIQREYFYDPKMHGADWKAIYNKYLPLLEFVAHRSDLGYLVAQVGGELTVGHSYLSGSGDIPRDDPVSVGLLGADISIENGKFRISRIYDGENWNPELQAPLSAPGVEVGVGDYILEVNGNALDSGSNFYSHFEAAAGRQTVLRINNNPSREGSRLITVVPVGSENGLRTRAWVEENRRLVEKLSGGRLAYVWLPNTGGGGYSSFTRYFYSQQDKEGAVIDERYNQGGMVADYIVNELDRKKLGYFALRDGKTFTSPMAGIYGPKVMLINESAGSGGDALPFYFRLRKIGPLIGTRTWGGLVGTLGTAPTIDGGGITAPSLAFFNLSGEWDVENIGVAPDIEVKNMPADVLSGRSPQIERAVAEALKLLEKNPDKRPSRPAPIDRVTKRKENRR